MNMKNKFLWVLCFTTVLVSGCSVSDIGLSVLNGLARTGNYQVTDSISYGPETENRLDVYQPVLDRPDNDLKSSTRFPVVVFFYGGCWGACSSWNKDEYLFVAEALTSKGYLVVVTDYRVHPKVRFAAIMDDASLAVEWVKDNIDQYAGDPGNIFLMGHSAGAQMAALLVLNEQYLSANTYSSVKGFVGLAGPYNFSLTKPYQKIVFGPEENYPASQPINFVSGSEPALMLMHGLDDRVVARSNVKTLSAKVNELGGKVETRLYQDIDHAGILASLSIPMRSRTTITDDIVDFLNRHTD